MAALGIDTRDRQHFRHHAQSASAPAQVKVSAGDVDTTPLEVVDGQSVLQYSACFHVSAPSRDDVVSEQVKKNDGCVVKEALQTVSLHALHNI